MYFYHVIASTVCSDGPSKYVQYCIIVYCILHYVDFVANTDTENVYFLLAPIKLTICLLKCLFITRELSFEIK